MDVKTTIGDRFASFAARGFIFLKMRSKKKRSFLKKNSLRQMERHVFAENAIRKILKNKGLINL
jgi:hypothetical protein